MAKDQPGSVKTDPYKIHAITLVALVITIIILIILAGVSLNLALGQNGIFTKSKEAVDKYKDAVQNEQEHLDNIYDNLRGPLKTDGSYNEEKGINTPVIKNPNANTKMELVRYDEEKKEWVKDTNNSSYNYVAGTGTSDNTSSHWANAKVTKIYENGESVESYFVWIPRYAYKITPKEEGQDAGTIDVVFLQGTTDNYIDEEGKTQTAKRVTDDEIKNELYPKDYVVHPAFTKTEKNGIKTYDNGEWSEETSGLWIGKYETSHTGCTTDVSTGQSNIEDKPITIIPNVTSWRNQTVGEFYTAARDYEADLNSHMLKNSEWGAVAYLTHSQYGRNGKEISINNNSNYITGKGNNDATSTGNEYGIYDLRGGAYEYVAAYYKNGNSSYLNDGKPFASQNGTSDAYSTAYTGTSESSDYKKGDATYETSGWNSDRASSAFSGYPFFTRGGGYDYSSYAGVFYFSVSNGLTANGFSFRLCLAVK